MIGDHSTAAAEIVPLAEIPRTEGRQRDARGVTTEQPD
jgi:hypothetical protein